MKNLYTASRKFFNTMYDAIVEGHKTAQEED